MGSYTDISGESSACSFGNTRALQQYMPWRKQASNGSNLNSNQPPINSLKCSESSGNLCLSDKVCRTLELGWVPFQRTFKTPDIDIDKGSQLVDWSKQ